MLSGRRQPERSFSKSAMNIQPIVEGHGEVSSVPILLRGLRNEAQAWGVEIARPHRCPRSQLVNRNTLQKAIRVAALTHDCAGILVLFDADNDCPMELAPNLDQWARAAAGAIPCPIVMANREYEAWFLASIESLRGQAGVREDARSFQEAESPRDAKGQLRRQMLSRRHSPAVDQVALTARFDLASAWRGCRSFQKFVSAVGTLFQAARAQPAVWPPQDWSRP